MTKPENQPVVEWFDKEESEEQKELLRKLKEAGERMTAEDLYEQKVSFILGELGHKSGIDRKYVEEMLGCPFRTPSEK